MDEAFVDSFDQLMELSRFEEAIRLAEAKVNEASHCVLYRERLGIALWMDGQQDGACNQLLKARSIGELSPVAELILIHALLAMRKRRQARGVLREFLACRQIDQTHLEQLASKFGKLQEYAFALEICQHLARKFNASADAWYGIGFYQEKLGCPPEIVVTPLRRAVLLSNCVCARVHLAKVLAQTESWREAYLLIHEIPCEALRLEWWAHTVFQVALANQDYAKAAMVRREWFHPASCD